MYLAFLKQYVTLKLTLTKHLRISWYVVSEAKPYTQAYAYRTRSRSQKGTIEISKVMETLTKQAMEPQGATLVDSTQCITNKITTIGRERERAINVEADVPQIAVSLSSSSVTHAKSKGT